MSPTVKPEVRVIVLDIEGTTTPVDFVYKTLFPYASRKLKSFLLKNFREPQIRSLIQQLYAQHEVDKRQGLQPPAWIDEPEKLRLRSGIAYAQWLMTKDSKCSALKSLQGRIWQEGYASGEIQGQVYADVPPAFQRWRRQKRDICIYSSGSIIAQQLLFRSIASGDLTPQITAFFDTNVGPKTRSESYKKIAESLAQNICDFVFISDAPKEIQAARTAGMQAVLCNRDVQASHSPEAKMAIQSFDQIFPD